MVTRTERRAAPDLNQRSDVHDRYEDLVQRYEALRTNAEEVVRENKSLRKRGDPAARSTAGVFLILLAFLAAGRLALYMIVEDGGTTANTLGLILNVLFGGGSLLLLFAWVDAEWKEVSWLAVPKYVFVAVMLLVCASLLSDGALLRGEWSAQATHPILAGLIAIVALLLAASPLAVVAVRCILRLLNDAVTGNGGE